MSALDTGSSSSIKPGYFGESKSGEVSYLDLQKNALVDIRMRRHVPMQAGDFQDPTNFIRNQISQTLHMRPIDQSSVPMPRRTYDFDRGDESREGKYMRNDNYADKGSTVPLRSPDVSALRSHINIGGTSVKLRNPKRLSNSSRKVKTMSWMDLPPRQGDASLSDHRRHSTFTNNEKFSTALRKMEERKKVIESKRVKNMDRRDFIEKEKRLKEDIWSNELMNLQKELDSVLSGNDTVTNSHLIPTINSSQSYYVGACGDMPKPLMVSENNNNNKTPHEDANFTHTVNSSRPNVVASQKFNNPSSSRNTELGQTSGKRSSLQVRKSLHFEGGTSPRHHLENVRHSSNVSESTATNKMPLLGLHADRTDVANHDKLDSNQASVYNSNHRNSHAAPLRMKDNAKQSIPIKPDLVAGEQEVKVTHSMSGISTSTTEHHHVNLNTFTVPHPETTNLQDVPVVSPYKSCAEVKVVVQSPGNSDVDVSGIAPLERKTSTGTRKILPSVNIGFHEQENLDPNQVVRENTFLSTYDSFANKITCGSNQSTPHKSGSPCSDDNSEVSDRHNDSSFLLKTADRNRKGGEGFELVDDTTPNTAMAKKKELFLLKQLKKEEELKRKRAEREQDEERKKEEARIKQEEINAKREEDKLKRQQILEEYKKRKLEQEENQRMRETGDIIASAKKHAKPHSSKHGNRKGQPYASSLAGSISNVSEAATAFHSDIESYSASVKSMPVSTKRTFGIGGHDWETESAFSSTVTADYNGPKLYKEPSLKSNKHIVYNAICHCCLPGKVNESTRLHVLHVLDMSEARHFMILFRDSKCQFRALYTYDPETEKLSKLNGNGPSTILPAMIDCLYKYNSGRKSFASLPSKTLSVSIDAVTIKNSIWQTSKRGKAHKK